MKYTAEQLERAIELGIDPAVLYSAERSGAKCEHEVVNTPAPEPVAVTTFGVTPNKNENTTQNPVCTGSSDTLHDKVVPGTHSVVGVPSQGSSQGEPKPTAVSDSNNFSEAITPEQTAAYEGGFDIENPFELLCLIDKGIQEGTTSLHPWQIQFMVDFASGDRTKDLPFKAIVRTCNGSGKDKYIISACAVWAGMRFPHCRIPITSSSGAQLDNQTDTHIRLMCEKINTYFGFAVWKINYRYYECKVTGSVMNLYATDEPGKAEGFHPILDGGKMCIFTSEAKSIPDEIFDAINRCTGFTHRVDASSPGLPQGSFYERDTQGIPRQDLESVYDCPNGVYIRYKVTAYDCPHISAAEIECMRRDMSKHVAASAIDAEFTTNSELVVIPYSDVVKAQRDTEKRIGWLREPHNCAGLDLSAGGDETVLTIRNGNKHLKTIPFRMDNTEDTVNLLDDLFRENGLQHADATIHADIGGLGEPMLRALRARGWKNIRFVDNRNTPHKPTVYLNRGAESWWNLRNLLEAGEIILLEDDKKKNSISSQLSSRKYKLDERNRIQLISKLKMKAAGLASPDRADSLVLCFWGYKSKLEDNVRKTAEGKTPFQVAQEAKTKPDFTQKEWANREVNDPLSKYQRASSLRDFSYLQSQIEYANSQIRETQTITE